MSLRIPSETRTTALRCRGAAGVPHDEVEDDENEQRHMFSRGDRAESASGRAPAGSRGTAQTAKILNANRNKTDATEPHTPRASSSAGMKLPEFVQGRTHIMQDQSCRPIVLPRHACGAHGHMRDAHGMCTDAPLYHATAPGALQRGPMILQAASERHKAAKRHKLPVYKSHAALLPPCTA